MTTEKVAASLLVERVLTPYVAMKISHMRRVGLIGSQGPCVGQNGGACPDWLATLQEENAKTRAKNRRRRNW